MSRIPDLATALWRKSSYSDGGDNNCLEVADGFPGFVPVRDSKIADGPCLVIAAPAWAAFVAHAAHPTASSAG
ncbi:DUF397 domain-containing protein [Streptomyces sp. NBC_01185]|uniref:DUF397 domain-containing protein n=1 Tax=Streptomyces sp. NBC_01185 TaxID=2903764 RepID=UPI00386F2B55|nr:DUF397 domain-containing protein [Streptomyces sp. NBC_01185]